MDARPTLHWFDNFDEPLGILVPCTEIVHTEQVKGEDTLSFSSEREPAKGDRLLWRDVNGAWREHVVRTVKRELGGAYEVLAESSICELRCDYIENAMMKSATAKEAVTGALTGTRWEVAAESAALGANTIWFYHQNAYKALREIEERWGCELWPKTIVADGHVARREVCVRRTLGAARGARFTYSKNLTRCVKTVLSDDVCTALYGWGEGSIVIDDDGYWTGGYTNRLSFASVNDGVPWVGSESARKRFGIWNKDRTEKVHRFGEVIFKDVGDARLLYNRTLAALAGCTSPQVSYEVDVRHFEGSVSVELGDTVAVIDTSISPEWRFTARVLKRVRTFASRLSTTVELETLKQVTGDKSRGVLIARAADVVDDPETEGKTEEQIVSSAVAECLAQFDLGEEEF